MVLFVKKDVTPNETILHPRGTFLIYFTNLFVLLMVYSEVPNGDNNLAKFAVWYAAVPSI